MDTAVLIVAVIVGVFSGAIAGWLSRKAPTVDLRPLAARQSELARQIEAMGMTLASLAAAFNPKGLPPTPGSAPGPDIAAALAALSARLDTELPALRAELGRIAGLPAGAPAEAPDLHAEAGRLRTELTAFAAEMKALAAALEEREAENERLQRALAQSDTGPLLAEVARLKEALAGSDIEAVRAEAARLQSRLDARDTELAGLRAHLTARATELALLKARQPAPPNPALDMLMPRVGDEPVDELTALREELAGKEAEIASIRYASALRDLELRELKERAASA